MRTPDAAMRTSPSHVYYLGRFSVDGDYNRLRVVVQSPEGPLQPGSAAQDARSIKFSKTGRYRVPSTGIKFSKTGRYRVPSTLAR